MALVRFAARDPGGANVLAGFLAQYSNQFRFDIWALPKAALPFQRAGFAPRLFPEPFNPTDVKAAWTQTPAQALVTGTSHYAPFEPLLWTLARQSNRPSLAILDSWINLPQRFTPAKPDFVGAVDPGQIPELIALGFAPNQIVVTGHPWLAQLIAQRHQPQSTAPALPHGPGVNALFVSEPIADDVNQGVNTPFGFTEFDSYSLLHQAAAHVAQATGPVKLAIKFHPYENPAPFLQRLAYLPTHPNLELMPLDKSDPPHPWIAWADLVAGISSMLLVEAILLNRPVVSLQPGLIRENTFLPGRRGCALTLTNPKSALQCLQRLLSWPPARLEEISRHQPFLDSLQHLNQNSTQILHWLQQLAA